LIGARIPRLRDFWAVRIAPCALTLNPMTSRLKIGILLFLAALATPVPARDAEPDIGWKLIKISLQTHGELRHRGYMLFMTAADTPGAAFRCEEGKLYTYLSTRPVDFEERLSDPYANSRNREVEYRLNEQVGGTEIWIQMYGGRIYMATEVPTTRGLFQEAASGGSVSFTRKHKESLSVALPAIAPALLDEFLQKCELKPRYLPDSVALKDR
jgi:hypothetical protein